MKMELNVFQIAILKMAKISKILKEKDAQKGAIQMNMNFIIFQIILMNADFVPIKWMVAINAIAAIIVCIALAISLYF